MAKSRTLYRQDYIHGSAVRKEEPRQPFREPLRQEHPKRGHALRHSQEKATQADRLFIFAFMIASCCTLWICINYLQVRSVMTRRMDNIKRLEQELDAQKSENDITQTRINTSVDLDYVYRVATEELGMVYANQDQIRLYHQTESEYVRQYEDIPNY